MSFEGHYDGLCKVGHKCGFPVLYGQGESEQFENFRCDAMLNGKKCGAELGYLVLVDDTNCDSYGTHEYIKLTDATFEECNLGHKHVTNEETYKFSDEEYYWDYIKQEMVLVEVRPVPPCRG